MYHNDVISKLGSGHKLVSTMIDKATKANVCNVEDNNPNWTVASVLVKLSLKMKEQFKMRNQLGKPNPYVTGVDHSPPISTSQFKTKINKLESNLQVANNAIADISVKFSSIESLLQEQQRMLNYLLQENNRLGVENNQLKRQRSSPRKSHTTTGDVATTPTQESTIDAAPTYPSNMDEAAALLRKDIQAEEERYIPLNQAAAIASNPKLYNRLKPAPSKKPKHNPSKSGSKAKIVEIIQELYKGNHFKYMDTVRLSGVQLLNLVPSRESALLGHTLRLMEMVWNEDFDILKQPCLADERVLTTAALIQNKMMIKIRTLEGKQKPTQANSRERATYASIGNRMKNVNRKLSFSSQQNNNDDGTDNGVDVENEDMDTDLDQEDMI